MRRQRAVQLVQLLTAGGGDVDGDAQVIATFALPQFQRFGVKRGVKLVRHSGDGVNKAVHFRAHDFDGEGARIYDEGFFNHRWCRNDRFFRIHAAIIALLLQL